MVSNKSLQLGRDHTSPLVAGHHDAVVGAQTADRRARLHRVVALWVEGYFFILRQANYSTNGIEQKW